MINASVPITAVSFVVFFFKNLNLVSSDFVCPLLECALEDVTLVIIAGRTGCNNNNDVA